MSHNYCIENLLGIQDISEINVEKTEETVKIHITHKRKPCACPQCQCMTDKVHDYRTQNVKDLKIFEKPTILVIRKRRYVCPECGKRFYEPTPYLAKYARMTKRLMLEILEQLRKVISYSQVARDFGTSVSTVIRIFDQIKYAKPNLPVTLAIDEFKGNTGGEKYNCIIADPLKHVVLDIIPKRYDYAVQEYFLSFPKEKRDNVQIFVSDMWSPYQDSAAFIFKNSMRIIDKYHWMRQITWAFDKVRRRVQKHLSAETRKYFKHSRRLLLAPFKSLSDEEKRSVNVMLYYSTELTTAHFYKELFQDISRCALRSEAKKKMEEWIDSAIECDISDIASCAKTMIRWKTEILNSFNSSCTNGFIEGCNNKIKVLKRVSYGCRNFTRFRNRILYVFSDKTA